ncbi:MAG: hypothetical protein ACI9QL_004357 [Candidatus Omnitrophota bacterium]|jgi:hypothetical protein
MPVRMKAISTETSLTMRYGGYRVKAKWILCIDEPIGQGVVAG